VNQRAEAREIIDLAELICIRRQFPGSRGLLSGRLFLRAGHRSARQAITQWARNNLLPGTDVRSDGLACFAGVIDADCAHSYIVVGARKPRELPQFTWVNTVLANLKTLINGGYKGFKFGKYARNYLGAFAYRFNARFNLRELLHDLLGDTATASPVQERRIRVGAEIHDESGNILSHWTVYRH
jgi:hypothetical protein